MRYLSGKKGAKEATVKEIGREVFEGQFKADYRRLVQSILVDYLGLSPLEGDAHARGDLP